MAIEWFDGLDDTGLFNNPSWKVTGEPTMQQFRHDITIKVDKLKLLDKLKENASKHYVHFQEALEGWKRECTERLQKVAIELKEKGKIKSIHFLDNPPNDMTSSYHQIIGMLEWTRDTEIELDQSQYQCFIEDKWDWSSNWSLSNAKYLSA